jgi:geranylgeranyl diphosphate synthase type I
LRDDILGIWGDQRITGKPVGSDILRRKKSYPVVFAWENSSDSERNTLSSLYQDDRLEEDGKRRVLEILDGTRARNHSQKLIEKYCQDARLEIEQAQVSATGRACFTELIEFLSIREF